MFSGRMMTSMNWRLIRLSLFVTSSNKAVTFILRALRSRAPIGEIAAEQSLNKGARRSGAGGIY